MSIIPDQTDPKASRSGLTGAQMGAADDTHSAIWNSRNLLPWNTAWPWLAFAAILVVLPFVFPSNSALTVMNQMAITVVFALSYNMLLGQGGMLSFGHAVYMGLGGFFSVHVMQWVDDGLWLPLPFLPILGGLFGLFFAFLVGSFQTRRAGTVFAMISLGIGQLVATSSVIIVAFFGGEEGVSGYRDVGPSFFGFDFAPKSQVYGLTAVWLFLSTALMYLFSRTPMGRLANAVRDNEERAEFLGYSQQRVRWVSFCWSGFFAGVAGALFAINFEILTEENLNLATSGTILLATFLGGVGFFVGPIVGAVVFTLLQTVLSLYSGLWQLYVGVLFVLTVMFFPTGLTGLIALHAAPWRNRKMGALAGPYALSLIPAILLVLSFAAVCEILFHRRESPTIGTMDLYGMTIDSHEFGPLAIAVVVLAASAFALVKLAPRIRTAWDVASLEKA